MTKKYKLKNKWVLADSCSTFVNYLCGDDTFEIPVTLKLGAEILGIERLETIDKYANEVELYEGEIGRIWVNNDRYVRIIEMESENIDKNKSK